MLLSRKNTDNTTQESTAEDDLTAADPDEDGEELDPEFSQDVENNEVIDADDAEEEAALDPITPSEYLVQNASDYVTLGDYDGVEVTRYTYEITDDMVQDEIQEELADASDEQSTNAPSEDGNIVYMKSYCQCGRVRKLLILTRLLSLWDRKNLVQNLTRS